jgi:nucleoside diphosphate kinase
MARELAYALITPHTIRKSRTGAVLSRLLGRAQCELVATQMVALTRDKADELAASIRPGASPENEMLRDLIRDYIRRHFGPTPDGRRQRSLLLAFCGENARQDIANITGPLGISDASGETIRDAFGDLIWDSDGSVRYFEPAVLISEPGQGEEDMRLWLSFLRDEPSLLENVCVYRQAERVQQTLVLIKPDSWRQRSSRPGAIVDMFSRTGLRIIGCKLVRMSVAQALEFYGPVRDVLGRKLSPAIGVRAREILEQELEFRLPDGIEAELAAKVGIPFAHDQFNAIVEFMTGRHPEHCPPEALDAPGTAGCLALVYEGEDAVQKIRDVLGPTDPTQAPDGTVRREFGSDVMVNTAHASDNPANAQREMGILRIRESNFVPLVRQALEACAGHA